MIIINIIGVSFARKVKELIKERGITQKKLATRIHISESNLSTYLREREPVFPSIETAANIAKELNVSLDYLCGINETREIQEERVDSAEILLKNLYKVIEDTNLTYTLGAQSETIFSTKTPYIYLFFSQIASNKDKSSIFTLFQSFKNLHVYEGNIINEVEYINIHLMHYIYRDADDVDDQELWLLAKEQRDREFDSALKEGKILRVPPLIPIKL